LTATVAEKKVALIPRVIIQGRMGMNEYALLLTDKQSIFVLEKGSKSGIAGAIGGVVAAAIAEAAASRKTFDYEKESVEDLLRNTKNIAIPHDALEVIKIKKGFLGPVHRMEVKYQVGNKGKKLRAFLNAPGEHIKQRKGEGTARKQIHLDYAKKVQDAYRQVLSPPRFESVMSSRL